MGADRQEASRPDPDALLRRIKAAEHEAARGRLKILLGYASGVGKSFRLFDEGRRRRERGEDVVVAAVQDDMSPDVAEIVSGLETIPTLEVGGVRVVDVPAILARAPGVCLIEALAHDNPSQARNPRRADDVQELLNAGISVITTINLEYIDDQQAFVRDVLGRVSPQVVSRAFIDLAEEVVVVDAPSSADTPERGQQLALLRSRALLVAADVVDRQLEAYLQLHGIQSSWGTQERILVAITPRANAAGMLASGRRNADRFHGELFAVYVRQSTLTDEDRLVLARNEMLARAQQAHFLVLDGKDPMKAILEYARSIGVTQIFVGHSLRQSWRNSLGGTPLDRLIRDAEGLDVRVFPH
jgi:two-component system sensor histidine kinase KdpD